MRCARIASRAGVNKAMLYYHFKSKDEILHSVFDRAMEEFISEGKRELAEIAEADERLRRDRAKRTEDETPLPSEDYLAEIGEAYNPNVTFRRPQRQALMKDVDRHELLLTHSSGQWLAIGQANTSSAHPTPITQPFGMVSPACTRPRVTAMHSMP